VASAARGRCSVMLGSAETRAFGLEARETLKPPLEELIESSVRSPPAQRAEVKLATPVRPELCPDVVVIPGPLRVGRPSPSLGKRRGGNDLSRAVDVPDRHRCRTWAGLPAGAALGERRRGSAALDPNYRGAVARGLPAHRSKRIVDLTARLLGAPVNAQSSSANTSLGAMAAPILPVGRPADDPGSRHE